MTKMETLSKTYRDIRSHLPTIDTNIGEYFSKLDKALVPIAILGGASAATGLGLEYMNSFLPGFVESPIDPISMVKAGTAAVIVSGAGILARYGFKSKEEEVTPEIDIPQELSTDPYSLPK